MHSHEEESTAFRQQKYPSRTCASRSITGQQSAEVCRLPGKILDEIRSRLRWARKTADEGREPQMQLTVLDGSEAAVG